MTETTELVRAAAQVEAQAARNHARASLLRATADVGWSGPGAQGYREEVAQRWAGLVRLADVQTRVAAELRSLARVLDAA